MERARNAAPPTSPWTLLGDIARTSVACLALAIGFAGLARRPGRDLSLLEELQSAGFHLRRSQARRSDRASSHEDYLRQISEDKD